MISTTANSSVKPELPASLKGKRILLVNHGDTVGEASGVTFRLMRALRHSGLDVRMLVFTKRSDSDNVDFVGGRLERGIRFCLERLNVLWYNGFNYANLFAVSTGAFARNIHHHPWAKEADIICLNWINQGLMNLDGIRSLHNMGKKIVWTMHDMWTFTGICHHSYDCEYYTDRCGNCIYLENGHPDDLSRRCWAKKKKLFDEAHITFVAETKCLELKARQSALLRDKPVMTICNPFNVDSYYTTPPRYLESLLSTTKPNLILIGASHLDHPDNGIDYAIEALNRIFTDHPDIANKTAVYLFGDMHKLDKLDSLLMSHRWLGRVHDQKILRYLYSYAKVFLAPTILGNMPGTLVESMAGGAIPVLFRQQFDEGVISHRENGYLAAYKDSNDLAEGVLWALKADISREGLHETIRERYSPDIIARQYIDLFDSLM